MKTRKQHHQEQKTTSKSLLMVKIGAGLVFLTLIVGNIVIFAKSVSLSDNIVRLEQDIRTVRKENNQLEQKLYKKDSLTRIGKLAPKLGFTKEAQPYLIDNADYALAR